MEITIISAQGLKKPSLFSHHLLPFITLTTTPPSAPHGRHVFTTTVAHDAGVNVNDNHTWGDKFDLSNVVDASFFQRGCSCIYLEVYSKRFLLGPRFLGWCGIPVVDIVDGFSPVGTVRRLSYRLRKKDGSRTRGVVNVAVKVESSVFRTWRGVDSGGVRLPEMDLGRVAIGIPVKGLPVGGGLRSSRASSQMSISSQYVKRLDHH
ncbi:putative C2 domain-containing protein [Helianthus debilis subsp. tardiflorus]